MCQWYWGGGGGWNDPGPQLTGWIHGSLYSSTRNAKHLASNDLCYGLLTWCLFSFWEFFRSKQSFKNCGSYCIRGPNLAWGLQSIFIHACSWQSEFKFKFLEWCLMCLLNYFSRYLILSAWTSSVNFFGTAIRIDHLRWTTFGALVQKHPQLNWFSI